VTRGGRGYSLTKTINKYGTEKDMHVICLFINLLKNQILMKKKVLYSLIAVCLLFSGFVAVKSMARDNHLLNAPLEALSECESGVYYQSMGYCNNVLTWMCTTEPTSEHCRRYACLYEQ